MEANRRYIDDKITFLYTHSLRKEVSKEVYDEFKQQLLEAEPGNMALRKETTDKNSKGISEIFRIPKYKEMLDDDHLTPIVDKFNAVANRDTRGLIFQDTDKKAQQTKDMNKLLKAANFEYNELITINNRVSYALDYARGCAYRNIYLASELINYVLGSSRGGGLTSVKDSMNISSIDATVDVNSYKLNESSMDSAMNVIANISDTILSSIDNKEMERFISKNWGRPSLPASSLSELASRRITRIWKLTRKPKVRSPTESRRSPRATPKASLKCSGKLRSLVE